MRGELERTAAGDVAVAPGAGRTPPWVWQWAWNAEFGGWSKTQFAQDVIQQASCYLGEWELGNKRGKRRGNAVRPVATS